MMDAMLASTRDARRPSRVRTAALATLVGVGVAACSGSSDDALAPAAAPTTVAPVLPAEPVATSVTTEPPAATTRVAVATAPRTSAPAPATNAGTTSSTTTLTTTLTTTAVTTSTLVVEAPAPQPIAPPLDQYASEPVIEVGSIAIPKLDVDMTMFEGIRLPTLDLGPGHWPGSALPGEVGNVVVGGHRVSGHQVFRNVDQLVPGDEIIFRGDGEEFVYRVDRVEIVEPTAIWIVDPTDTPTATLFACHPPGSTAQRIVVFADLADAPGS